MDKLSRITTLSIVLFFSFSTAVYSQSVTGEVSLVDRLGVTVLSYETGDSVYVLVSDADRNVSTSASDTLTVRLRSDKETTEEALVLTETGINTGIFSAYMLFDETGSVSADGKLQVDRGDKLVGRYRDPSDDFGNVANETSTSFYGLTVINGGSLLGNTTWNTAGSPYLLTGDITVPNTVTLTIESGVEVRFTPLTDDLSSGEDVNRIELIIEGILRVKGAQSDTVTFMSNGQVPASGDWYGIVSTGNTGKVLMDYASINNYTNGIRIKEGTWSNEYNNSDTISVSHTKFYGGGSAISSSYASSYRPIYFTYNKLVDCGLEDQSYTSVKHYNNNTVTSASSYKTFQIRGFRDGSNSKGSLSINNNTFEKGYIYVQYPEFSYQGADIEINNNILGRGSYGIRVYYLYNYVARDDVSIEIKNNQIIGSGSSSGYGTELRGSGDYGFKASVENNTIKAIGRGVYVSADKSTSVQLESNTIDSTYYQGIYLNKASGRIESNTVTKCGKYSYFGIEITSDFNYPAIDTIQYNTITGNGYWQSPTNTSTTGGWGGIKIDGYTQAKINYNNIYDNGAYEVVNNVAASAVTEQDAKFNYWGTYNNSQIALGANPKNLFKVYDKYDNSSLGFVNYGGYLNAAYPNGVPSSQSVTGEVSLVDRLGVTVLSYETGDSVYVLVSDADRNVSTSASDTLTVRLRSDKETTEEALVLTETGINTGIFSAYMLFDETGSVSADGKLQVDRGDKLVGRYRDPSDDFGNVANETSTSFYGLTVINGGSLLGNTTWNTAGSPYLLTGDITVPNTVTLTIESGVEVRFTPLTDDLSSGEDVNRIELIIEGILRVKGAQSDTVTFMSNGQVPASGDWYGIVSTGNTGKVLMDYASINNYTNGIRIKEGTWSNEYNNSDTISVSHTKFYGGGSAISSSYASSYRPIYFTYNKLVDCGLEDQSYTSVKHYNNNTVTSASSYKTFQIRGFRDGSNSKGSLSINNNTFEKGYIYVQYPEFSYQGADIEINNNILGRGSYGIRVYYLYNYVARDDVSIEIKNNQIIGSGSSSGYGTELRGSGDYGFKASVENNTIKAIGRGVYVSADKSTSVQLESNTIDSTYYQGIYLNKASGRIESNTVTKCGKYSYFGIEITSDFNYPAIDTIQYNTITGNGYWQSPTNTSTTGGWGGIKIDGYTQAKINYNNIYDNGAYEVVNNVAASAVTEQDAKFNYWGTYNNSQIALGANPKNLFKVYDKYDNSSLGFVNYGGYLNAAYPNGVPSSQSVTGEVSLVDRLGVTVLSYETGDSVYVLVSDADRNVSTSASDTLTVRLRSDKETTEEALVLTETGINTGIFSAYMLFDETGSVSADGKLQVDRGDKLVGRYRDPSDDFGNVANETSTSFYGLTVINGGSLLGNTTWNTAGSPYLLTGDITVPNTVTLTIESGVEVRFTPLTDDLSSGEDVNRIELIIEGILRVKGAQSDTVTFMSNGQVPASGDWYGIVSTGNTGKVLMDYASINNYTNGIRIKEGTWSNEYNNSDTISVSHTKFYGGGSAISSSYASSYRPIYFTYNKLVDCGLEDQSYTSVKHYNNNTVTSASSYKTFQIRGFRDGSNSKGSLSINNNTFEKGYIYVQYPEFSYQGADIEINNNILGRGSYGIRVYYLYNYVARDDVSIEIKNNQIIGSGSSSGYGTELRGSGDYGFKASVENNTIKAIGRGVYVSADKSTSVQLESNTIDSTYYQGIYLNKASGRIESNTVTKCGKYSYFGIEITSDFNYPAIDTIQYNTITGNGYWQSPTNTSTTGGWGGIKIDGYTQAKINYNNIYDNGAYEVVNNVAASAVTEQDAKFNYWGTYNNSQIALGANPKNLFKVYDKYDNSSLGFVNYGQNQSDILFDELPDSVFYGGDSLRIATSSNKYGDWSTGETNANHVDLTGYEGELIFTYTLGSDILKDTVQVINLDAIYVSNSGSNQNDGRASNRFKTIQKAIDEADAGDTIYIASGNYSYFRILEDQLYVHGEDSLNRPVITGHDTTRVIEVIPSDCELHHLALRNGLATATRNSNRGGLLYSWVTPLMVQDCDFKDGKGSQGGDYVGGGGKVTFIRCQFYENTKNLGSVGRNNSMFMADNGTWLKFYNCFVDAEGTEKIINDGETYEFYNSTIVNLTQRFGIQAWSNHKHILVNNILVEKPGYNPEIFPADTTYFWNGWNGDNIYLNNRFPRSISSMTHWNGAQLISTNNDTLPVLFRDSANGDYRLSIYDRHLDKGTDTVALYSDTYGVSRVDSGGFVDYGAYETNGRGIIDVYACPGDDIDIDPFGITAPVWNNGDQGSTDVGLGKYWASGTINGNAYVDTFMVIDAGIEIQSSDTIVCPGTEVTLTAVGWQGKVDPIFTWGDGTVNVSSSATVSQNTTFYLYSDFDGISCTDSFTVYVNRPAITSSSDFACAADSTLLIVESQMYLNNQISASSSLNDSMLLWMPFDGTIKDESPGSNSFTNTGVVLANGRNGSSGNIARLDGDSYLEFDSPIVTGQKQMTFAFWAQTNSNSAQDIIGQNCGTDCGTDVRIQLNPAQCSGDGLGFKSPAHFAAAPQTHDSSWHHYALVMGSGDNFSYSNFKFYIDGVEVSNSCGHNWGGWTYTMPNEPLRIGKGASLGTNFNGLLDDIGVWKRALAASEVQELAAMGEDLEAVTQVLWSTGETNDSIWVKQNGTSQYWVQTQLGDAVCSDSVKVFTAEIASSDTIICPGTAVTLNAIGINGLRDVPASYVKLGQLGDKQYFLDTTVQSWTDANASALSNGFSLVDIQDSTENAAVGSMVSGSGLVQNSGVWIGVYQDVNASNYSEPTGGWTHVKSNSNYYPWALGEPNNAFSNPGENFAELYLFNGQPVWADLQNSFIRYAVVEVPTYMYEPIYWSTGDTGVSTVVTPTETSTYYLSSENAGLTCSNSITVYVNEPVISASTRYICEGDSALLTVGSQSFFTDELETSTSITWSTGSTNDSIWINQSQTTDYWVQTTLGDAVCTDTITINSAELIVSDQFLCKDNSLSASISGWDSTETSFVYWNTSDTSNNISLPLDTTIELKVYSTIAGETCIDSLNIYVNDATINTEALFLCSTDSVGLAVEEETTFGLDSIQSKRFEWSTGDSAAVVNLIQDSTTVYFVKSIWGNAVCYDTVTVNNKFFTNPADALCYGGAQTIQIGGWNSDQNVQTSWSTGDSSTSIMVSPLVDTVYYVTTSYAGVSCTDTAHIYVNDARITASSNVVCVGDSISLSIPELSSSGQSKSILWSTGDTTNSIWVSQDSTTTYWVSVGLSDAGCSDTVEILTTIPVPQISSSFTTSNLGTGVDLSSSLATTYLWSDSTSGSSINVYPSVTTDYWVKVTDTNACVGFDTLRIEASDITFRVNMRTQIVDTAKGVHLAGNFQGWSPSSTAMYDNDGDGIYEVTLGLVSGDTGIEFKYINGNSWTDGHDDNLDSCSNVTNSGDRSYAVPYVNDTLPVFHLSSCDEFMPINPLIDVQSFVCVGDTTFLDAGEGLSEILWNTGDTSRTIGATTPGWYWFIANYPHKVRVYDSTYVNFYAYTDTSLAVGGPTSFCDGDSVLLSVSADVVPYWNNGASQNSLPVTTSGSYYATVLDSNGCSKNTDTVAVNVWQLPNDTTYTFGGLEICDGDSTFLYATFGYDYYWNNGDSTYFTKIEQAGSYSATITDANGCVSQTDTLSIIVNSLPNDSVYLSGPAVFCDGDSVVITSAASGVDYNWSNGSTFSNVTIDQTLPVSVTITDQNGCVNYSDTINVVANPLPDTSITVIGSLDLCPGDTVTLAAQGGMNDYFWSNGTYSSSIDITQSGSYNVALVNSFGCIDTSNTYTTILHPLPNVSSIIGTTSGVTPMQQYVYVATQNSGSSYSWNITNGVIVSGQGSNVLTVMWSQASNGQLTVIEDNGYCQDSSSVSITTTFSVSETLLNPAVLFPNPTQGKFKIVMNYAEPVNIHLIDSRGNKLSTFSRNLKEIELDATEYPAGVYQVVLEFENEVQTLRLVLLH